MTDTAHQVTTSEDQTRALAQSLARGISETWQNNYERGLTIYLKGDLGSGKTTFAKYLLQALGHEGQVKSPSYTLCESYDLNTREPIKIFHFDLYRMKYHEEWLDAGFRDYFSEKALRLIEWPEMAGDTLPPADGVIQLTWGNETSRTINIQSYSACFEVLIRVMK